MGFFKSLVSGVNAIATGVVAYEKELHRKEAQRRENLGTFGRLAEDMHNAMRRRNNLRRAELQAQRARFVMEAQALAGIRGRDARAELRVIMRQIAHCDSQLAQLALRR